MRILHFTIGAEAGGLSRYLLDLCTAVHNAGHDVTIAGDSGPLRAEFEAAPFPYLTIPIKGGPVEFLQCLWLMRRHMATHPVDIFHTHYRRATILARRLQHNGVSPPVLYTVHLSHMAMNWWRRPLTDFGDQTHVAAEEAKDWIINTCRVPESKVSFIPHGIDLEHFPQRDEATRLAARARFNIPPDARVACFVGRFDYPKNENWILDLAARTRKSLPDLHILMAGEGPHQRALDLRIAQEGLNDRVRILGYCNPLPVYQAADALLLPSIREGFALVCAEAASVGVPSLRTRTSGTSLLIKEDVTGRSVPIDHQTFLRAAESFLRDREALQRMGKAAATHVREHFGIQRQVDATLDLYRQMAKLS